MEHDHRDDDKPEVRQVTYTAGHGDPVAVDWHGMRFVSGVPREISDRAILDQVAGNPHFAVDGQDKAKEREDRAQEEARMRDAEGKAILDREGEEMKARHDAERASLERRQKREQDAHAAKTHDDGVAMTVGSREHDHALSEASSERMGPTNTPSVAGATAPNSRPIPDPKAREGARDETERADRWNMPDDHVPSPLLAGRPSLGTTVPATPAHKPADEAARDADTERVS